MTNKFKFLLYYLDKYDLIHINDKKYLEILYSKIFEKKLNLDFPKTFNEKLQWLKLYNRKNVYTTMVDKYEVKKYVASIIGEEYIIPTIGIYNSFDEMDFNKLPNQFVIKCTHDSGGLVIVKDKSKLDIKSVKKKINTSLKHNYFYNGREWPYKNVKPRVIVEKYMEDSTDKELKDYKFFCFNGEAKIVLVCSERFTQTGLCEDFFDINWNHLELERPNHPNSNKNIERPHDLNEMLYLAKRLSDNIPFVRVDFYEINNQVYFGEMTFFPASGFEKFVPDEWDNKLGDMIILPKEKSVCEK